MENFKHPQASVLKAAPGTEDKVNDLAVFHIERDDMPFVASLWKPSPEELELLNKGECVLLGVNGYSHAAVFVTVTDMQSHMPDEAVVQVVDEPDEAFVAPPQEGSGNVH